MDGHGSFSGALTHGYINDGPANVDNSITVAEYFITDFNPNYHWKNWTYSIIVENLFDTVWNETQFATESRLFNEASYVNELHFTPGTLFYIRGKIATSF